VQSKFPRDSTDPDLKQARQHLTKRIGLVTDSARRHGFTLKTTKRGVPYLDTPLPPATFMSDAVVSDTPRLGALYYGTLSSVAHARISALTAHTVPVLPPADRASSDGLAVVRLDSRQAALNLLGAPLAAVTVASQMLPTCGFDIEALRPAIENMLHLGPSRGGAAPRRPGRAVIRQDLVRQRSSG